jgi:hypothetical protein
LRIVVPFKFKAIMENNLLYPEGWRYREFVGNLKTSPTAKWTRMNGNSVVDQVMEEVELGREQYEQRRQEQLKQLQNEQGGVGQAGGQTGSGPLAQQ